jgi:hypothetical protein
MFRRVLLRARLGLAIASAAWLLSGCISVHVQHETEHPVVVPANPPPPPNP